MSTPTAQIIDFAYHRAVRAARALAASRVRRQFLWNWPLTGQLLAADFPLPAADFSSRNPESGNAHAR